MYNEIGYFLVERGVDGEIYHGAFKEFGNALNRFAFLANMDIEPDWTQEPGWGWITNEGREFGILPITESSPGVLIFMDEKEVKKRKTGKR